jgi:hypothetical protein
MAKQRPLSPLFLSSILCLSLMMGNVSNAAAIKGHEDIKTTKHEADVKESSSSSASLNIKNPFVVSPEERSKLSAQTIQDLEKLLLALQYETNSVSQDLMDDQELMTKDVAMLWQAAVERSSSIRFALEKLSKQDETGKPVQNNNVSKRLAQNAARVAGAAGSILTANPAGLIGSGMIEQILFDDSGNSALLRVTDADMVILAKEVEGLQSRVIELYYAYKQSKDRVSLTHEASEALSKYYDQYEHESANSKTPDPALQTILSSLYESAKQDEGQAKQRFATSRNELEIVVGPDAVKALETAHEKESAQAE